MTTHRIAVIAGDGIGRETMPEGIRVLEAAGAKHGIRFEWQEFPWSCDWYKEHGRMCPQDAPDILRQFDAIFFGAVGNPAIVPDHVSAWGLLINFRRWFDLYVNLRPVRLFEGLPCPLAGRKPGDIDYIVLRENTEGEYGNVGGRVYEGTEREVVMQQAVFSRKGVDRIMKYGFELARRRDKHLTSCTKSNGISITMPYWDERFAEMKKHYPDVRTDQYHVDGLSHPDGAQPGPLRRHRLLQPVRRHPLRPRTGDGRHDRHCALGQHQSGAHRAVDLRAGARLGAGHRRQEDRQPDRADLVGCADARASRPCRRGRGDHRRRSSASSSRDRTRPT